MADKHDREHFIPFRKADIVDMCIKDFGPADDQKSELREFAQILQALFHFEFHQRLETLKNCYAPFNPDSDTRLIADISEEEKQRSQKELIAEMTAVLQAANFERITAENPEQAIEEESLFKIRLEVDFEDFEDVIFFRRGKSVKHETLRQLYLIGHALNLIGVGNDVLLEVKNSLSLDGRGLG